jgi:FkbM family methyltransferase
MSEGNDTLFFSNHLSEGKIFGFEPILELFNQARSKVVTRNNVQLSQKALSDKEGEFTIYVSDRFGKDWGSSSLLPPKEHLINNPDITFKTQRTAETILLDKFLNENGIDNIDLMWLDMQGYEPFVLKSSPKALAITKFIYTEVSLVENYEGLIKYPELKEFLESMGYSVVEEGLYWSDGGNVLFKNEKLI